MIFLKLIRLASWELIIASLITIGIDITNGLGRVSLLAFGISGLSVTLLIISYKVKRYDDFAKRASSLNSKRFQLFLLIPIAISIFLFFRTPSLELLQLLAPLIFCGWLIGLQIIFLFYKNEDQPLTEKKRINTWAFLSILFAYGFLILPSKIPTVLDGIPWDVPIDFIFAIFVLPVVFITGCILLNKRIITFFLAFLFFIKLWLFLSLPQTGLGVRAYTSTDSLESGQWQRGYESIILETYTQVTQSPYQNFHEFPIEWINFHTFKKENFWLALEIHGTISLQETERLIFYVQGTTDPHIELLDIDTNAKNLATIVKFTSDINQQLYETIPYINNVEIAGLLIFPNYGQMRLEPLILKSDGSTESAFPRFSLSPSSIEQDLSFYQFFINGISILFIGIILASLINGIFYLLNTHKIKIIDLYLALSGISLYYITNLLEKTNINIFFLGILIILVIIKFIEIKKISPNYSWISYFFSIGIPILCMFFVFEIQQLKSVTILPPYQDAMEYQMLARNIYVNQDIFLLQTPPWSYKVLYPYIVGIIHILFGQSMSAQLFLNAWCAILSIIYMASIAKYFGVSRLYSFLTSVSLLCLLFFPINFVYYFRFGLIEPLAIMTLLATVYFAKEKRFIAMFMFGVFTGMLRLNFAGAIFTAITFLSSVTVGKLKESWATLIHWCLSYWKQIILYLICIPLPALLITYFYSTFIPTYTLSPDLNRQDSFKTVIESLLIIITGGDAEYFSVRYPIDPFGATLIILLIITSLIIAIASLIFRNGVLAKIDIRLSLFLLSMLPVYAILKPIAYFPRYSWSLLPPAIIVIALFVQYSLLTKKVNS
jgi:hypothetical protein